MCKETIPGYTSLWAESQGQVAKEGEEEDDHKPRQGLHQMEIDQKWINGLVKSKPGKPHVSAGTFSPWFPVNFMVPSNSVKKNNLQFSAFFKGANPDANHGAGRFTYMTGSFLGFLCR